MDGLTSKQRHKEVKRRSGGWLTRHSERSGVVEYEVPRIDRKGEYVIGQKRLAEWNRYTGKTELFKKIDGIRDSLLEDVDNDDIGTFTLAFKLTEKIKDIL